MLDNSDRVFKGFVSCSPEDQINPSSKQPVVFFFTSVGVARGTPTPSTGDVGRRHKKLNRPQRTDIAQTVLGIPLVTQSEHESTHTHKRGGKASLPCPLLLFDVWASRS
jgi:hypothetical protein